MMQGTRKNIKEMSVLAKLLKRLLALGVAAMLLLACAACNGNKQPEPADPEISEEITTEPEPETLDAASTEDGEVTEDPAAAEDPAAEGEETTDAAEATTGAPKTKAEIVAYYNAAVTQLKEDKPGYTMHDRTIIDKDKITSSSGLLSGAIRLVFPMIQNLFTKWSDPSVKAKGANIDGFPPKGEIKPEWIRSATCTVSGGNYRIKLIVVDENLPVLPASTANTIHGKVIDRGVYDQSMVMDGVADIGMIDVTKFACKYSGCYIDATVNIATGAIVKVTTYTMAMTDVEVKVLGGRLEATVPLGNETEYYDFGK